MMSAGLKISSLVFEFCTSAPLSTAHARGMDV